MSQIANAVADIRSSKTWTQRIYYISPLLEGLLKAGVNLAKRSTGKGALANQAMSAGVERHNRAALAALRINGDTTTIRSGPFAGMRYLTTSTGSLLGPKIIGRYEEEIAGWVQTAIGADYDTVLDIGSAEGYYAVGMAYANPRLKVVAYDVDPRSREMVAELARLNDVAERVEVRDYCDHAELQRRISEGGRTLVIVDIEGFENDLLDPANVPALFQADMIVELHEQARPGVSMRTCNRFVGSHEIDLASAKRDETKIAEAILSGMEPAIATAAAPEGRGLPQLWLRLTSSRASS